MPLDPKLRLKALDAIAKKGKKAKGSTAKTKALLDKLKKAQSAAAVAKKELSAETDV